MSEQKPTAGWHPDPDGSSRMRYWNGEAWTDDYAAPETKARKRRWWIIPVGIVGGLIVVGMIGSALGDDEPTTAQPTSEAPPVEPEPEPPVEPEDEATPEPDPEPEPEPEPAPEEPAATADAMDAALRSAFGLGPDDPYHSLDPTGWAFYVTDIDLPNPGLLRVTMQTDRDDPVVEGSSRAIFSLIGAQFPDLDWVEVVDGVGTHIEQTSRREVPLLNQ